MPSRLASGAVVSRLMPVAFPPGRKARHQAHFDGIAPRREHDWYGRRGGFRCEDGWFAPRGNQYRNAAANEFRSKNGKTIIVAVGPTVFDRDVLPLDVSVSL